MRHVDTRQVKGKHVEDKAKPLTEPVVFILLSLAQQPRHGYGLAKDIEQLSHGRVQLTTGTLYGALRRLLDDGWIERFDQEDTARDKQSYRLTDKGLRHLKLDLARMTQMTRIAAIRLRSHGGLA